MQHQYTFKFDFLLFLKALPTSSLTNFSGTKINLSTAYLISRQELVVLKDNISIPFIKWIKKNFICRLSRKVNFGQNIEIGNLHFCAGIKFCTQPVTLADYQRSVHTIHFLYPITFLSLFQLIEMLICIINFFEFE